MFFDEKARKSILQKPDAIMVFRRLFVVIRFAFYNGKGPVQLFNKEQAHHLVRKCHAAEG
jgi:hypothetical protein